MCREGFYKDTMNGYYEYSGTEKNIGGSHRCALIGGEATTLTNTPVNGMNVMNIFANMHTGNNSSEYE